MVTDDLSYETYLRLRRAARRDEAEDKRPFGWKVTDTCARRNVLFALERIIARMADLPESDVVAW